MERLTTPGPPFQTFACSISESHKKMQMTKRSLGLTWLVDSVLGVDLVLIRSILRMDLHIDGSLTCQVGSERMVFARAILSRMSCG